MKQFYHLEKFINKARSTTNTCVLTKQETVEILADLSLLMLSQKSQESPNEAAISEEITIVVNGGRLESR